MPESTALKPALRVMVMSTRPPAPTLIGKVSHPPWSNAVVMSLDLATGAVVDRDRLTSVGAVPVDDVEPEVAGVARSAKFRCAGAAYRSYSVAARRTDGAAGILQRTHVRRVTRPARPGSLVHRERHARRASVATSRGPTVEAAEHVALRPVGVHPEPCGATVNGGGGGVGGGPASPRKMPESTALAPAVRSIGDVRRVRRRSR